MNRTVNKVIQKCLALLLATMIMLADIGPGVVYAMELFEKDEYFEYELTPKGYEIKGITGKGRDKLAEDNYELTIPNYHKDIPVVSIADKAFENVSIKTLNIDDNLKSIGDYAFYHENEENYKIEKINVLSNEYYLEKVGVSAFENNLLEKIPNIKNIKQSAFKNNNIENIDLSLTESIGEGAFLFNDDMKEVTLNKNATIADNAFNMDVEKHLIERDFIEKKVEEEVDYVKLRQDMIDSKDKVELKKLNTTEYNGKTYQMVEPYKLNDNEYEELIKENQTPDVLAKLFTTSYATSASNSKIESLSVKWILPDKSKTDKELTLKWPENKPQNVRAIFEFSMSGTEPFEPGELTWEIPKYIFKNRNGKPTGRVTLGVPEVKTNQSQYSYYETDNSYIVVNTQPFGAGESGFFEMTINDLMPVDIKDLETGDTTDPLYQTMRVKAPERDVNLEQKSNEIKAKVDTMASLSSPYKEKQHIYEKFPSSWDQSLKPKNPEDYIYVSWTSSAYPTASQPYKVNINDISDPGFNEYTKDSIVLGIRRSDNRAIVENNGEIYDGYASNYRSFYNTIYTAYPKKNFFNEDGSKKADNFRIDNKVEFTLTPYDDKDKSVVSANSYVVYTPIEYKVPEGHFYVEKWGRNSDLSYQWHYKNRGIEQTGLYPTALNDIQNNLNINHKYKLQTRGFGYPYTLGKGLDSTKEENYQKESYTMITKDETVTFDKKELNNDDYEFKNIQFTLPTVMNYEKATSDTRGYHEANGVVKYGDISEGQYYYKPIDNRDDVNVDVLITKDKKNYEKYATVDFKDKSINIKDLNGNTINGNRLDLPENTLGFKLETTTSKGAAILDVYPTITIKANDRIKGIVKKAFGKDSTPFIYVSNKADLNVKTQKGNMFINENEGFDFFEGFSYGVDLTKEMKYEPNANTQQAKLNYIATMKLSTNIQEEKVLKEVLDKGLLKEEKHSYWYDLLPKGVVLDQFSVTSDNATILSSKVIANYKNSGRDLLIVETNHKPNYEIYGESGSVISTRGYNDTINIKYTAYYDYINFDSYGDLLINNIVYQTTNDMLGNVKGFIGEKNDTYGNNHFKTEHNTRTAKDLINNVGNNGDKQTIYGKDETRVVVDRAGLTGVRKLVRSEDMTYYTNGQKEDTVNAFENQLYRYKVSLKNDLQTKSTNIVVYDNLENYKLREDNPDYGDERWRGEFRGINLDPLIARGVKPTVYYSTVKGLDLENNNNRKDNNISDKSIWTTTKPNNKDITAVAVDLGNYTLNEGDSLYYEIMMKAPDLIKDGYTKNLEEKTKWYDTVSSNEKGLDGGAHAYNNITMISDITSQSSTEKSKMTTQSYTKVGLKPFEINVSKMFDDGNNRDNIRNEKPSFNLLLNDKIIEIFELNDSNNYKYTIKNILGYDENSNPITYDFVETNIPKAYKLFKSTKKGRGGNADVILINKYKPEKIKIKGTKTWSKDSVLPKNIKIRLKSEEGTKTYIVKPDDNGDWNYEFEVFKYYKGKPLNYTIEEVYEEGKYFVPKYNGYNIHNIYKPYSDLTISKEILDGNDIANQNEFTFSVVFKDRKGDLVNNDFEYIKSNGKTGVISTGGRFKIKNKENIKILNIPIGYKYEIREADKAGFKVKGESVRSGYISRNDELVVYENQYSSNGRLRLRLGKKLKGRDIKDYQFVFELYDENNKLLNVAGNNKEFVNFPSVYFTNKDLDSNGKATKVYTIKERNMNKPGYTYDGKDKKVTITLEDDGQGNIIVKDNVDLKNPEFIFNNKYEAKGTVDIVAYKFMERINNINDVKYEDFKFNLKLDNVKDKTNKDIPLKDIREGLKNDKEVLSDKNGKISFDSLNFDQDDVGKTFEYIVSEVNTGNKNVIYDNAKLFYIIKPVDNGNGTLSFNNSFRYENLYTYKEKLLLNIEDEKVVDLINNAKTIEKLDKIVKDNKLTKIPLFLNKPKNSKINIVKETQNGNLDQLFKFKLKLYGEKYKIPKEGFEYENKNENGDKNTELTKDLITWSIEDGVMTVFPDNGATIGYFELNGSSKKAEFQRDVKREDVEKIIFSKYIIAPDDSSDLFRESQAISLDLSSFNTSKVTNMSDMFNGSSAKNLDLSNFDTSNVTNMSGMFRNSQVTSLDLSSFNTSKVTDMSNMFYKSQSTKLDVSKFDTSNVTNMSDMFRESKDTSLDISKFDTSKVTNMSGMFKDSKIKSLNLTLFNTNNVTNMSGMFNGSWVKSLDLSSFDTSNVTNMSDMFRESKATSLDVSKFDTSKVTNMSGMFYRSQATSLDLSSFDTSKVTDMSSMFAGSKATSLDLSSFDTSKVTDMSGMFVGSKATSMDLLSFSTSKVTDMRHMFGNSQVTSLDLSSFDTSKVTNMSGMFMGSKVTSLDLSSFDTSNVTDMNRMFYDSQATSLDLSSFDTSKVTNMSGMFMGSKVTSLDLSSFNTSNVTDMRHMFRNSQVTSLDLSSFNTSNVTSMSGMFMGSKVTSLDLSSFNTSKVTSMRNMFNKSQATSLNLSSFNISKVTDMKEMFRYSQADTIYVASQEQKDRYIKDGSLSSSKNIIIKPKTSAQNNILNNIEKYIMPTAYATETNHGQVVHNGTQGGVTWEIFKDGHLLFRPTNGISGTFDDMVSDTLRPWYKYNGKVKTISFDKGVKGGKNVSFMFEYSKATSIDLTNFDTSNVTDMSHMFRNSQVTSLDLSSFNTNKVTSMSGMFMGSKVTSLDLSSFDTSNVTDMNRMFYDSQATSLDLSSFNTSNVTDMSGMFSSSKVTNLDLSNFNTSNVTNMSQMFNDSWATSLDLSSFDTSNVTNMSGMFNRSEATSLDVSKFDTSKVTDMSQMFNGSWATSLDLSSFDTSKVTNMSSMFERSQVTSLDLSSFDTSKVTNMSSMFERSQVTSLDLSSFDTSNVTNMSSMFNSSEATSLDLSSFDTSNVTNMSGMFRDSKATSLDLSSFNTSNVTNMSEMFRDSKATSLDLSNFDTSKVISMNCMFTNSQATTLDVSKFNTSNVTDMSGMFYNSKAISLDVSKFDTSKVTNMYCMFYNSKTISLDVSKFDTSNVTNMSGMFYNSKTISLDVSKFDTSNVTNMSGMFYKSQSTKLDVSKFDTSKVTDMSNMFYKSQSTKLDVSKFDTSKVTDMNSMFDGSQAISLDVSNFDTSNVTNMSDMFKDSKIKSLNLTLFNTNNVTNMSGMFNGSWVKSLDLSSFDTSNVTNMSNMFRESKATSLDLSSFDTSNVTNMSGMFYDSQATSLDLSSFDTSKVTDMSSMFAGSKATSLDLSSFDTSKVTDMRHMFGNSQVTSLDLSSFDTSKVTNMSSMFGRSQVTSLDLSSFDTSNVTDMNRMFYDSQATSLDLSSFDTSNVTDMIGMFYRSKVTKLDIGSDFKFKRRADLPNPTSNRTYTGKWIKEDKSVGPYTADELMNKNEPAILTGTWVWEKNQAGYTITFDKNNQDAQGNMANVTVNKDDKYIIPVSGFYQRGKQVIGYSTNPNATEAEYTVGEKVSNIFGITNNEPNNGKLYAIWKDVDLTPKVNGNEIEFSLYSYQEITFNDIPAGMAYEVYEETPDGWQLVSNENTKGITQPNQTHNVKFVNKYTPKETQVTIRGEKYLDNVLSVKDNFSFTLKGKDENGTNIEKATVSSNGLFDFDLKYTKPGNYTYTIEEVKGNNSLIEYDSHIETITVNVVEKDGVLITTLNKNNVVFNNTTKSSKLLINKKVEGTNATDIEFDIEVFVNDIRQIYKIKNKETIEIPLKYGDTYKVNEINIPDGYSLDKITNQEGTVKTDSNTVNITNKYEANQTFNITGYKKLELGELKDNQFKFALYEKDKNNDFIKKETVGNNKYGDINFKDIQYTQNDVGEHEYKVEEVIGKDDTIQYDNSKYMIKVKVSDNGNGTLSINKTITKNNSTETNNIEFVNYYIAPPTGYRDQSNNYIIVLSISAVSLIIYLYSNKKKYKNIA